MKVKKMAAVLCIVISILFAIGGLAGCTSPEKPENKNSKAQYIEKLEHYYVGADGYGFNHGDEDFVAAFLAMPESAGCKERMEKIRRQGVEQIKASDKATEWQDMVYNTCKEIYACASDGAYYAADFKFAMQTFVNKYDIPEQRKQQAENDMAQTKQKQGVDRVINEALLNRLNDRLYYYSCDAYKTRFVPGLVTPQTFCFTVLGAMTGYEIAFSDEYENFTYDLYCTRGYYHGWLGIGCNPGSKIEWAPSVSTYIPEVSRFMAIVYDEGKIAGYVLFKYTSYVNYGGLEETSSITVDASVLFEKDEEGNYPAIENNFFDGLLSVYEEKESFVDAQTIYKEEDGAYTRVQQLYFPLYADSDEYEYVIGAENGEIFELENFGVINAENCNWEKGESAKTLTLKPGVRIGLDETGENELIVTMKEKSTGKEIRKVNVIIKKNEGRYDYTYYVNEREI